MCNNAMVYNAPETIYYKAAKKLVLSGSKLLSPVSIIEALFILDLLNLLEYLSCYH